MNLLSIHPKYLDKQALISLWREGLTAQKVLNGELTLKKESSLLKRFRQSGNPIKAIGAYLSMIASEGARQGCKLNHEKIICPNFDSEAIELDSQQIIFEMNFLKDKLKKRDTQKYRELKQLHYIETNPVFDWPQVNSRRYNA